MKILTARTEVNSFVTYRNGVLNVKLCYVIYGDVVYNFTD